MKELQIGQCPYTLYSAFHHVTITHNNNKVITIKKLILVQNY